MPGAVGERAVRIEGLRELERAFKLYGRGLEKGVREALEASGEPVRRDAEALARTEITRIGIPWSKMRVGVTRRTAYVAPVERGRNTKRLPARWSRPKFADKLQDEVFDVVLNDQNIALVEREIGDALDDLGRMWSRV